MSWSGSKDGSIVSCTLKGWAVRDERLLWLIGRLMVGLRK